jgi:hypothetical protein
MVLCVQQTLQIVGRQSGSSVHLTRDEAVDFVNLNSPQYEYR